MRTWSFGSSVIYMNAIWHGFEDRQKPEILDPVLYSWCHTSLFGIWDFKSNQNLKFSGFNIWTCSSWSNRKFEKSLWFMILFYLIYIKWYIYISFIWVKGFTHPTGCCEYYKRDLRSQRIMKLKIIFYSFHTHPTGWCEYHIQNLRS